MSEIRGIDPSILEDESQRPNQSEPVIEPAQPKLGQDFFKVVEADKVREPKAVDSFKKARVFDVEATDLHDINNSIRYTAKVDAPGKDKVYRRTFRFVITGADRLAFLQNRPTEMIKFSGEDLVRDYADYRNKHGAQRKKWMQADWLSDEQLRGQLADWGYQLDENEWERPVAQSVEQEIAGMLKDNYYDLSPKAIHLKQTLGKSKESKMVFNVDHRNFSHSLKEVGDRVEIVLGLLEEGVLPLLEKYRAMPFSDISKIENADEKELAMQTLAIFAGIPTKALQLANKWVEKGRTQELLEGYEISKSRQQSQNYSKDRKRNVKSPSEDAIFIFETLGLRLRSGEYSFATQAVQDALIKRLKREPRTPEEVKDSLDMAKEFVSSLNLTKIGFKGLQKKIEELTISDKDKGMVYLAASLEAGYSPRGVIEELQKKKMLGPVSRLEVFRTSARVALELIQQKAKNKEFIEYTDVEYFDKNQDMAYKDPNDKRQNTFVVRRRAQAGTGAQFVDVAIIRQVKAGEKEQRDRVFHLPFKDNSVVNSLENAKELQSKVSGIFFDRQRQGQRLSFVPYIELLKSRSKANPSFRLSLGAAQAEVDYKSLYDTLSFKNRVEAELVKAVYLDSKTAGSKAWETLPTWKKQAVYKFQDIISHSGLPSLTEQLIVRELLNKVSVSKIAVPILSKDRKMVKAKIEKPSTKVAKTEIKPMGSINPEQLRKSSLAGERAGAKESKKPVKKIARRKK